MKRINYFYLFMAAIICMVVLRAQDKPDTPKLYTVSFTEQEWNQRLYGLELIKGELKRSDLPAKNVAYMTDSILSKIQSEVIAQIRAQVQTDTSYKKQHK